DGERKLPGTSKVPLASTCSRWPIVPVAPHLKEAVAPDEVTTSPALWPPHVPVATSPDELEQAAPSASAPAAAHVRHVAPNSVRSPILVPARPQRDGCATPAYWSPRWQVKQFTLGLSSAMALIVLM